MEPRKMQRYERDRIADEREQKADEREQDLAETSCSSRGPSTARCAGQVTVAEWVSGLPLIPLFAALVGMCRAPPSLAVWIFEPSKQPREPISPLARSRRRATRKECCTTPRCWRGRA